MNIYQDRLLEKYQEPKLRGHLPGHTHSHKSENLSCGDEVTFEAIVKDGVIIDLRYHGDGCIISQASAEIIAEELKGKAVTDVMKLDWEDIIEMLGVQLTTSRIKCAHIALSALQGAISTEAKSD